MLTYTNGLVVSLDGRDALQQDTNALTYTDGLVVSLDCPDAIREGHQCI